MEEKLSGNSYKSRMENNQGDNPETKKIDRVVSGTVKRKKKNTFLSTIFTEDASRVKSYVLLDVLIPAFKKTLYDIITSGMEILLYGEARSKNKTGASRISYASYYNSGPYNRKYEDRENRRSSYDYDDIIIDDRGEAEEVLNRLEELVDVYGMASIADFYELVGITGNFTDNKYGWKNLHTAKVVRTYKGYYIDLPKAEPLN